MTTEEKIQHFYKVSVDSAREEARQEMEGYRKEQEALLATYKEEKRRQAEADQKIQREMMRKQIHRDFYNEQMQVKRRLSRQQNEWKTQLFREVEDRLNEFRNSPGYVNYLAKKCKNIMAFAGEDEVCLMMCTGDQPLAAEVEAMIGHPVIVEGEFGGGIRAVIATRNILIDESFMTLMETEKTEFEWEGRMTQ